MFHSVVCYICVLTAFYHSQLPSNLYVQRLGVTKWISFITLAWGAVQLSMGFVSSWGVLAFCRVLLGAFEVNLH